MEILIESHSIFCEKKLTWIRQKLPKERRQTLALNLALDRMRWTSLLSRLIGVRVIPMWQGFILLCLFE